MLILVYPLFSVQRVEKQRIMGLPMWELSYFHEIFSFLNKIKIMLCIHNEYTGCLLINLCIESHVLTPTNINKSWFISFYSSLPPYLQDSSIFVIQASLIWHQIQSWNICFGKSKKQCVLKMPMVAIIFYFFQPNEILILTRPLWKWT